MEKRKNEKDGKNKSWFSVPQHTLYKKFEDAALIEAEKSVTENLIGEKEKWTNKGNGKHHQLILSLHNATNRTQHLYQISKS